MHGITTAFSPKVFRTRFHLSLLRERDALWLAAGPAMRERLLKLRATDDYTYLSLQEVAALQASQDEEHSA